MAELKITAANFENEVLHSDKARFAGLLRRLVRTVQNVLPYVTIKGGSAQVSRASLNCYIAVISSPQIRSSHDLVHKSSYSGRTWAPTPPYTRCHP